MPFMGTNQGMPSLTLNRSNSRIMKKEVSIALGPTSTEREIEPIGGTKISSCVQRVAFNFSYSFL